MTEFIISNELVSYPTALDFMKSRVEGIISGEKRECVWLLQHPPLYTGGTSAKEADLLQSKFPVFSTGRGGQYTYHGPGQIVGYVMVKLEPKDVKIFVQRLEEWLIATLREFGIEGSRREGRVGIWVSTPLPEGGVGGGFGEGNPHSTSPSGGGVISEEKIAAIGIRLKKWVSFHGVSINVNPDLSHFGGIVPCGISEFGVTSMHKLGVRAKLDDVMKTMIVKFDEVFA